MRTHEIESWARSVIDQVNAGQPNEDQRVELKAGWIDAHKAARRIAGHANAARGGPILWLIGVDEKKGVTGAGLVDLANWYPQVESQFEGLAPNLTPVNIPAAGNMVVALLFETERAPFVVKVEGTDRLEVPWRGSTSVRSARRDELLRLLSPLQQVPTLDVVGSALEMGFPDGTRTEVWGAALQVYITPKDGSRIVIPFHRCKGELTFTPSQNFKQAFAKIAVEPYSSKSTTVTATDTEAVINGPGMFVLTAEVTRARAGWKPGGDARVTFDLYLANMDHWVTIDETMPINMLKPSRWGRGNPLTVYDKTPIVVIP